MVERRRRWLLDHRDCNNPCYLKLRRMVARRLFEESLALSRPDTEIFAGAFSYTGRYVARRLLGEGIRVSTLTRSPEREDPFGGLVLAAFLDFSVRGGLRRSMEGTGVLYNT